MREENIPDPPEGYKEPYEYEEIGTLRQLLLTSKGRKIVLLEAGLILSAIFTAPTSVDQIVEVILSLGVKSTMIAVVVTVVGILGVYTGTVIIHENIHRFVDIILGYDVKISYGFPRSYAIIAEQMISRKDNLISLSSPFLVLSSIAYLLSILITNQIFGVILAGIYFFNVSFSAGDIYGFTALLSKPEGTKVWIIEKDGGRSFVYEPE
jgi:hypothetical protein